MARVTGLVDRNGRDIREGDRVSLDGNVTADDSLGPLPNGWNFGPEDVYRVYWDGRIRNWSLDMGVEPDSSYNRKYLNHALSLLHGGDAVVVDTLPTAK